MSEYPEGQDPFSVGGSTEGTTREDAHKGGGGMSVNKEGLYHVQIESVQLKAEANEDPHVLLIMNVLNGVHEDQIGRKVYHRIYMKKMDSEDKEQKRIAGLATFMFEFGVMSEQEAFGNANFSITRGHFERLESCQAVVKVSHRKAEEYTDKKTGEKKMGKESYSVQWNNNVWNPFHEFVKDVPKDHEMLQYVTPLDGATQTANDLSDIGVV